MYVKAMNEDTTESSVKVEDKAELISALQAAAGQGNKLVVEPESCDFTKENFAAKPDLNSPGRRMRRQRRSSATTAGGRWCCGMGRGGRLWLALGTTRIRRARRFGS
jgi:hypothetical protein